ncbi:PENTATRICOPEPTIDE REPEAT (PPR) SUPERFAMILY PROTEIN [Salix viminalis]|uniref:PENTATRICOPEPTIDE REPEAT (PPR) SUPERFAMILY PROTEIN n=1 Tax=Salix viminalis TaxID=40686 RepID=A0A9Q0S9E5_SALVM|nr:PENTATRICOPEPTIDE REPEAT (PPR) SUPERFAMILY PROTEIN [Salix viminalis]
MVEVEDFMKAKPDAIALSAARIISLMKASGEKITQTFKSMCWRCKGIQVEEVAIIDVDSLGFDLRVCSGTQIQTMRVAFNSQVCASVSNFYKHLLISCIYQLVCFLVMQLFLAYLKLAFLFTHDILLSGWL